MTDIQRAQVIQLRKAGNSYGSIARTVGISLNTVKSFCRRNNITENSDIRNVLMNITYTGNLLLQKEYISDPITKKRKKNRGELPQYYVENSHPAIIDKETFDYVQSEIARRKELGPLANKSLNISCFTGKIKCPYCGLSYMHNARKPRTEYGQVLEFWVCGSRKKKGGRCQVKGSINQGNMEKVLAEVLGLDEFDEDVFSREVEVIYVLKAYTLEIHMTDGRVITKDCPNTGHKDCWTPERRARKTEFMKQEMSRRKERGDAWCKEK